MNKALEIKEVKACETWKIRQQVMWADKPIAYVKLENDESGLHYGIVKNDELISVISLFQTGETAQFRKFATLEQHQRQGYGKALLAFLVEASQRKNIKTLWCNARVSALPFYEQFGFEPVSEAWYTDEIAYIKMSEALI
jgi:predicted GNAT family N-acyltransferase